jgi:hypothetical protein
MSVALFHRGARLVIVARRRGPGNETWWSPCRRPHDWGSTLGAQLALLGLEPQRGGPGVLTCRLGRIAWRSGRRWATILVDLDRGSDPKRQLVTAALLKAARYARPAGSGH